ncbi:MAG: cytochrome c3 family protein [Coriobacteriia bacterium]|nr:cytochrome c3 family protein [Coriobacteriia bacterium]
MAANPSLIRVTSAYDFYASAALRVPARVTVRYRIPVTHFQVANTVARNVDWRYLNTSTGTWSPVTTTIDTNAGTLTATMPHFSYWQGLYIQPHGTTFAKTGKKYCTEVCHNLTIAPIQDNVMSINDSQVCYNCHGNMTAGAAPAGVDVLGAQNVQSAFFAYSGQSFDPNTESRHPAMAPGSTTGVKCTLCHNPHADPTALPYLLRAFDPVTGRAIQAAKGAMPGNEYCWSCHGVEPNPAVAASLPDYWADTRGDMRTLFSGTGHARATEPGGIRKGCLSCHTGHSAGNTALIRSTVGGTTVTGNDRTLCYACHIQPLGVWSGRTVFSSTGHAASANTSNALTSWPGLSGSPEPGGCRNCHDVHGTSRPDYTRATGDVLCKTCHDDASNTYSDGSSYRGPQAFVASVHGGTACAECHAVHGVSDEAGGTIPNLLPAREDQVCIACHKAGSTSTRTTGTAPRTWNGRDLAVEFARPSHHPVDQGVATLTASPEPQTLLMQGSLAEFDTGLGTGTQNLIEGGVQLNWGTNFRPRAARQVLLEQWGADTLDALDIATMRWNNGYDPTDRPGYGTPSHDAVVWNNAVYFSEDVSAVRKLSLSDGESSEVWSQYPLMNAGGLAIDVDPEHDSLYVLHGEGSGAVAVFGLSDDAYRNTFWVTTAGGTPLNIGTGSAAAYSPQTDRLYFVNVNRLSGSAGGDGHLMYVQSPSTKSNLVVPVDTGIDFTTNQPNTYTYDLRMRTVSVGGTEYLFATGQDATRAWTLRVFAGLGGSTVTSRTLSYPAGTYNPQEMSLSTDGAYIYSVIPSTWNFVQRIRIPADPMNDTWSAWESIGAPRTNVNAQFGAAVIATVTPPPLEYEGFALSGTYVMPLIGAPPDATTWSRLTWDADVPAGTTLTAKIEGFNDAEARFETLVETSISSLGQVDLTGFQVAEYNCLQVTFAFASLDPNTSPTLREATVDVMRPGHLYVAGSEQRPSIDWLGVRPATGFDTFTQLDTSATLVAQEMEIPPHKQRLLWMQLDKEVPTYFATSGLWRDPALGFSVPDLSAAEQYNSGSVGAYYQDDRVFLTRANKDGLPAFHYIRPTMGEAWTYVAGTGDTNRVIYNYQSRGWAVPSLHGVWAASFNSLANRTDHYKINTETGSLEGPAAWLVQAGSGARIYTEYAGAAEYSSLTDTLLIVDRGWDAITGLRAGTGRLWQVTSASTKLSAGGAIEAVDTGIAMAPSDGTASSGAAELVVRGGREYLLYYSNQYPNPPSEWTGALLVVVDPSSASPTLVNTTRGLSGYSPGNNPSLTWDGGDYVYMLLGEQGRNWRRMRVPADPAAEPWPAWDWTPVAPSYYTPWLPVTAGMDVNSFWGAGTQAFAMVSVDTTVGPLTGIGYTTETIESPPLTPGDTTEWGWLTWTATEPAGTDVAMTVQTWNGLQWQDIAGFAGLHTSPVDLGSLTTAAFPQLRVIARLSTDDAFEAPSVANWRVTSGTDRMRLMSDEVVPAAGATSWGAFTNDAVQPAGTDIAYTIKGWNGSSFVEIPGFVGLRSSNVDLSGLRTADWPRIQVSAWMTKSAPSDPDPTIRAWSVTSLGSYPAAQGALGCSSCHDPHVIGSGGSSAWDLSRVSDPADTKSTMTGQEVTTVCLGCHDSGRLTHTDDGPSSVPYSIAFSSRQDSPLFTGWDKQGVLGAEFTSGGHYSSASGITDCAVCHDPHASNNARLTAWTRPAWFADGAQGVRDNTSTAAFEQNLCYQCHGNGTIGKTAPGALDVATPAGQTYGHPVGVDGRHSDTEQPAMLGVGNRHSECVDCHDPHAARAGTHTEGSSRPAPALLGAIGVKPVWSATPGTTATSYSTVRFTGRPSDLEAYLCFKCHTTYTGLPDAGTHDGAGGSDLALEFNPANQSYHNVLGLNQGVRESFAVNGQVYSWGWAGDATLLRGLTHDSKMTCTDCHTGGGTDQAKGPHGSSVKYMLDPDYPSDWATAELDFTDPSGNGMSPSNILCAKCHVLSPGDNNVHNNGGSYASSPVHRGSGVVCNSCHINIPHGWKRPRLLGYASDPEPYATKIYPDSRHPLTAIRIGNKSPNSWLKTDCAGCSIMHPHEEDLVGSEVWP